MPGRTLDSFGITDIGFIKLDVEGSELEVLKGATESLVNSGLPKILFESWDPWRMPEAIKMRSDLFSFLDSIGYKVVPIRRYSEMFLATSKG